MNRKLIDRTDWERVRNMTEEEIEAAANSDPDCPLLTDEELKQTKVTQPAIFLHSVILAKTLGESIKPDMVAGHSLGEFSALVVNKTLSFEDALILVSKRAMAMQKACEMNPSTMAAVLNLDDKIIEDICAEITRNGDIVVAANYN